MRRLLSALCLALLGGAVSAAPAPDELLQRMADASRNLSFRGHALYARGDSIRTLEVLQGRIDDISLQRVTSLDGDRVTTIRRDGRLFHLHPDDSLTALGAATLTASGALPQSVAGQYHLAVTGSGRIAGRNAWRLTLLPLDEHRYGHRLWIDEETHLLLRADTLHGSGRWLERFEFVSLELNPRLDPAQFALPATARKKSVPARRVPTERRPGLEPGWLPPGFTPVHADAAATGRAAPSVLAAARTWTDGLAGFTLFPEPAPDARVHQDRRRFGPTVALSRPYAGKGWQVTLVGEIPLHTAERILDNLELRLNDD